jgi:hypothetical protein
MSEESENLRSRYAPFITLTSQLSDYKQQFIDKINDSLKNANDLYQLAFVMRDHAYFFDEAEKREMDGQLFSIEQLLSDIAYTPASNPFAMGEAKSNLNRAFHDYLRTWLQACQTHGVGLLFEKGTGEVDLLMGAMSAKPYFINSYGFAIHWSQDVIARAAVSRIQNNFDNLIFTYGRRGFGKSTWNDEVALRMLEILGKKFDMDKQFIVNMPKHELFNYIKTWKKGDVYIFDEFINEANARTALSWDSVQLMELIVAIRKVGATAFMAMPDLSMLDKALREHMITLLVRVTERGKAIVMAPTLEATDTLKDKPQSAIILPQDLTAYIEKNATNRLLTSTFYEIPEDNKWWMEMDKRSKLGISTKTLTMRMNLNVERMNNFEECLKAFPEGRDNMSLEWLAKYSEDKGYNIPPEQLANWLSKKLNIKRFFVLEKDGKVLMLNDPIIKRFIKRLKNTDVKMTA